MFRALLEEQTVRAQKLLAHPASRQLIRYIIAGLMVTQFSAAIYTFFVMKHVMPYVANVGSTACGVVVGYFVHSRWSFRGGNKDSETLQLGRFLIAAGIGFSINSFWVWLITDKLGLSPLAPVPLMMAATPVLSFLLNRYWVFRAA